MLRAFLARLRASPNSAALLHTGALTGAGFVISLLRDVPLAATYGGSASLDVFFVALGPTLYWGTESANLAYLGAMPALAAHHTRTPPRHLIVAVLGVAVLSATGLAAVAAFTPSVIAPGLVAVGKRRELAIAIGVLGLLIPLLTIGGLLRAMLELARRFSFWATLPAFRSAGVGVLALATAGASTAAWLVVGVLAGLSAWLIFGFALVRHLQTEPPEEVRAHAVTPLGGGLLPLMLMILIGQLAGLAD